MNLNSVGSIRHTIVMVLIAISTALLLFQLVGYSAGEVLQGVITGSITGPGAIASSIRWAIPLFLIALGVLVSFRAGYFNVGGQGQAYLGAIAAYAVTHYSSLPAALTIALALIASLLAGAFWALIAAVLKEYCNTDETLATLMLNYIAILVLQYFAAGPFKNASGSGQVAASAPIPAELRVADGDGISVLLIVLVVVAGLFTWLMMTRSKFGLLANLGGKNPEMLRWQGGTGARVPMTAFGYGGALAGLAGATEVMGSTGRLVAGFSPEVGFTAVLVAITGLLTVQGAVIAAIFFGMLQAAVQYLPLVSGLPPSALPLIQGVIAILITAHFGKKWGLFNRGSRVKEDPPEEAAHQHSAAAVVEE